MSKPPQGWKRRLQRKTKNAARDLHYRAVTLFLTVLFLNLRSGEKQIRYELAHRFAVSDPQFVRSMNHLLGPGILAGNPIKALQIGKAPGCEF